VVRWVVGHVVVEVRIVVGGGGGHDRLETASFSMAMLMRGGSCLLQEWKGDTRKGKRKGGCCFGRGGEEVAGWVVREAGVECYCMVAHRTGANGW
jgi:hypothetical protein